MAGHIPFLRPGGDRVRTVPSATAGASSGQDKDVTTPVDAVGGSSARPGGSAACVDREHEKERRGGIAAPTVTAILNACPRASAAARSAVSEVVGEDSRV
jgi:hypothetical protein